MARSLVWFTTLKGFKRLKDVTGLAPKGRLITAQAIEREIGQIGQARIAAGELHFGSVGFHRIVEHRSYVTDSIVRSRTVD
jgi:hypothetical protein